MGDDEIEREGEDLAEAASASGLTADNGTGSSRATGSHVAGRPRWRLFLGLAVVVLVADQLTKAWLVGLLAPGESLRIIDDWLRLVHTRNTGALFGLFRDQAPIFATLSAGVIGLIVLFHARSGRSLVLSTALGLLLGGAIGNFTDRLRLGHVVDFVDAGIGDLRWYTFNVADAAISGALLLLILLALRPSLAHDDPAWTTDPDTRG